MKKITLITLLAFSSVFVFGQVDFRNKIVRQIANGDTIITRIYPAYDNLYGSNPLWVINYTTVTMNSLLNVFGQFYTTGNALLGNAVTDSVIVSGVLTVDANTTLGDANDTTKVYSQLWVDKKISINGNGWMSQLACISDNNNSTSATRYSFNFVDGSINKTRTTYAQATDTCSFNMMFSPTGKIRLNIVGETGNSLFKIDTLGYTYLGYTVTRQELYVNKFVVTGTSQNLIAAFSNVADGVSSGGIVSVGQDDGSATGIGSRLGSFYFRGMRDNTGTPWVGSYIASFTTENWTTNKYGAYLAFYTTPTASGAPTEKFRIGNNGALTTTYTFNYGADAGSSDTYACTIDGISAYTTGAMYVIYCNTANTGACTVNINAIGAKALKSLHDQDPQDNYIEAGSIIICVYDGTNMQIQTPDANP